MSEFFIDKSFKQVKGNVIGFLQGEKMSDKQLDNIIGQLSKKGTVRPGIYKDSFSRLCKKSNLPTIMLPRHNSMDVTVPLLNEELTDKGVIMMVYRMVNIRHTYHRPLIINVNKYHVLDNKPIKTNSFLNKLRKIMNKILR